MGDNGKIADAADGFHKANKPLKARASSRFVRITALKFTDQTNDGKIAKKKTRFSNPPTGSVQTDDSIRVDAEFSKRFYCESKFKNDRISRVSSQPAAPAFRERYRLMGHQEGDFKGI
jgi:hypothetical protein